MGMGKKIVRYFIAGALGGLVGSLIFSYLPYAYIAYSVPFISVTTGVGVIILGLILEKIIKE